MKMSKVIKCEVKDCAYNMDNCCHTMAITVGDDMNPKCDSFCPSSIKGGEEDCFAGVGSCKVSGCMYNEDLECCSPGISVGYKGNEPDCLTFECS